MVVLNAVAPIPIPLNFFLFHLLLNFGVIHFNSHDPISTRNVSLILNGAFVTRLIFLVVSMYTCVIVATSFYSPIMNVEHEKFLPLL